MTTAKYLTVVNGVLTQVSLDLSNGSAGVTYKVVTSGTGYTVGDTLLFIEVVTQVSPTVLSPVWININTGLEVSNPNVAHLVLSDRELGQTTMSRSTSVALASDQTLPLPTGAATSANQSTGNTSLASIDGGIGGASAAAAADTGASTTNGFLRWIRDFWLSLKGTKTAVNSLSVTGASDGSFGTADGGNVTIGAKADAAASDSTSSWSLIAIAKGILGALLGVLRVGGSTADGSTPAAGVYSIMAGGKDSSGNQRTLFLKSGGELPTYSPALNITENWNAALTSSYQKVATTTAATKMLRMSAACNATAYDIEFQVVAAGGAAPTTAGMALLAGDDFPLGIPIGDIYARSASLQKLIVWSA